MSADARANKRTNTDLVIGARVRERRLELGLSQRDLGGQVSVTFQQIQKYENGTNRISASRLLWIAAALKTSPEYFIGGVSPDDEGPAEASVWSKDAMALLTAYQRIKSPALRKNLLDLARTLSRNPDEAGKLLPVKVRKRE
jgi:transcriptional regulator with XRE-family HTH domain